jgi:hypothetical protein
MAEDKAIYTASGLSVPWLNKTYENHLDKTTLIFGGTNSGKSTLIEEIMYMCKDYIPNTIVIAPQTSRGGYVNKLKPQCIKEDLTKQLMQNIWDRQVNATQIYKTANDPKILRSLFCKSPDREEMEAVLSIARKAQSTISDIERTIKDFSQRRGQINNIIKIRDKNILNAYKRTIRQHKDYIGRLQLTIEEKIALEYLDFNPRLMLIIDDCSEMVRKWNGFFKKGESNIFECIFYKGRHNYITFIFACHDDKIVTPELRKNTRLSIYASKQVLITAVNRGSSGFTPQEKKDVLEIAEVIFHDENAEFKSHRKLCYIREEAAFKYTVADLHDDFSMVSDSTKDLIAKLPSKEANLLHNPFIQDIVPEQKKKPKIHNNIPMRRKPRLKYEN